MLDAQREDGLFAYELDVSDRPAPRNPKNWMDGEPYGSVVRQAGAALFLADYRPTAGDLEPQVRAATRKALDALAQRALTFENGTLLTLGEKREHNARAGATALALAATLELSQVEAGLEDMRKGYLRALVALRTELVKNRAADGNKPGPGEQSWYAGFAQSPDELRASAPCYNGEAWYAVARYRELYPDEAAALGATESWLQEAEEEIMHAYEGELNEHFFHWGIQASVLRGRTAFADSQVQRVVAAEPGEWNRCAEAEALGPALAALEKRGASAPAGLQAAAQKRLAGDLVFSFALQLPAKAGKGTTTCTTTWSPAPVPSSMAHAAGGVFESTTSSLVRIDDAGHCARALAYVERLHLV
jgi:hypothetical protein